MTYTLYGEAAPERIVVSLVVVYKKVEKSVISVCEEAHKSYRCISWLCKVKVLYRKRVGSVCDLFIF